MKKLLSALLLTGFMAGTLITVGAQPLSNNQYNIARLKETIKHHKLDLSAHMALTSAYYDEKEYEKMYNLLKSVLKRFKTSPIPLRAINTYSLDFYRSGEYNLAKKFSKLALSKYKNDPDTALIYSKVLMKTDNVDASIKYLETFLKHNPDDVLLHEKLYDMYVYKQEYEKAFKVVRRIQDRKIENIMFYFLEALTLLESDKQKSMKYLTAYFDKLKFSEDYRPRITVATKLYKTLKNTHSTADDYIELIEFSENNNAPVSYILLQARYASKLFPDEPYFNNKIDKIFANLAINITNK